MRRTLLKGLVAVALVAAAYGSACGSDGEPDTTTTTPPATQATTTSVAPTTTTASTPATTAPTSTAVPTTILAPVVEPVTFIGADGVESTIGDSSRVVVLAGDLVEVVFALGAGDRVVAVDVTAVFPSEVHALPKLGFGQQAAAEPILGFGPTLVIGDQLSGPPEAFELIRAAGVPVVILETQTTLPGVPQKIMDAATVLGLGDAGVELASQVETEIADAVALTSQVTERQSVAFVYVRGPETILLFGQGTLTQALIEGANAIDTISESGVPGLVPLSPEALVAAAPDVIIVPTLGLDAMGGIDIFSTLPGVAETPAGQAGNFLTYEDGFFLNFGPRTGQTLLQLVLDLYPELATGG